RDASGRIVGASKVARDITERKRSEQIIAELNEKVAHRARELQAILDTAPVGIHVAEDPQCKVITSNRALAEMLGMPQGENVSMSRDAAEMVTYRVFKDGRELCPDELPMQRAAAGAIVQDDQLEIVRADGSKITVLVNAQPL